MSLFGDGLEAAVHKAFTRPISKSAGAQMRYLVKQLKGTRAVAQMLRISQRTVERYVKDQIKKPRPDLAARLEREVKRRWQGGHHRRHRHRHQRPPRLHRTHWVDGRRPHPPPDRRPAPTARRPPPRRPAGRRQRPATPADTADALREVYFQDGGRRAGSLDEVRFTDIEHLEFEL
ncbi:telomere-protecting terminal protein Tpg [Streptomyces pseudogriseolus]|uniref:telomere-protecting terminal protein Tpg n=1 Tax=Streptomyces pseudogriseolus TaxID=36817 RepID=UPI003FA2872D